MAASRSQAAAGGGIARRKMPIFFQRLFPIVGRTVRSDIPVGFG
jgi:hypothetical protein